MIGRLLAAAGAVLVAVGVAYLAYMWWPRPAPASAAPIVEAWSSGAETFAMDLPAECAAQRLEYAAWQIDAALPAQLDFVVSQLGDQVHTTGTGDFTDYTDGAADWTLKDDAVYALTARGINARWRFAVTCAP